MNILPLRNYTFDKFVNESAECRLKTMVAELEAMDKDLCKKLPRNRYKIIRINQRTLLTSLGPITFKRRYVFDKFTREYCFPLDIKIDIPSRNRVSNELKLRIIEMATKMTYRTISKFSSWSDNLSPSTVCRIVRDLKVKTDIGKPFESTGTIHVQIDEKYMYKLGEKNKRRHYTATIFDRRIRIGKGSKWKLTNRQLTSAEKLDELKRNLRLLLVNKYCVKADQVVFVSGDFASYIQLFPNDMEYCKALYVPDKFHACSALSDELGLIGLCSPNDVMSYLKETSQKRIKDFISDSFKKVVRCYRNNTRAFELWNDPNYLGCSQEGMNSHYYAPRFGKRAAKFKPETISKLCLINEALLNGHKIEIGDPTYIVPKYKVKIPRNTQYIPLNEQSTYCTHTTGKFRKELDKWLNPIIIF